MSNEQWAKETAEILEYWFNDVCNYKYISKEKWWKFKIHKIVDCDGYVAGKDDFENPIDCAIYLAYWFLI